MPLIASLPRAWTVCGAALLAVLVGACRGPAGEPSDTRRRSDTPDRTNASATGPRVTGTAGAVFVEKVADQTGPIPIVMMELGGRRVTRSEATAGVLKVIDRHDGTHTDLRQAPVSLQTGVSVELHGDSSGTLAKKSYQIELVDDARRDRALPLLGLPAGSDWVLHNCGFDPICLRNALTYGLARRLGHYAPRTRFLELFVDGRYDGLYVLVERVRRQDERVRLPRPADTASEGDLTGGYIFRMNLGEGEPTDRPPRDWVSPVSGTVYSYLYPRFDRITDEQRAYLHGHVERFETLMRSSQWNDPRTGYSQWLDLRSWVDFALLQELSLNPDAYFKSVYLQKRPRAGGDRIAIGPVWDFDLAFGIAEFRDARNLESWAHTMNRFGGEPVAHHPGREEPYVPEYWVKLWTDPAFHEAVQCRWRALRRGPLDLRALRTQIDERVKWLWSALERDAARWPDLPKNSYTGGADALKTFLERRIAWMDAHLPGRCADPAGAG